MSAKRDETAKEVLWQLALARAETQEVKALVAELLVSLAGKSGKETLSKWKEKRIALAEKIYLKAAKAAGLEDHRIPNHNGDGDLI